MADRICAGGHGRRTDQWYCRAWLSPAESGAGQHADQPGRVSDRVPDDGQREAGVAVQRGQERAGSTLAMAYNFLWAPLVGWLLARAF